MLQCSVHRDTLTQAQTQTHLQAQSHSDDLRFDRCKRASKCRTCVPYDEATAPKRDDSITFRVCTDSSEVAVHLEWLSAFHCGDEGRALRGRP